MKLKLTLTTAAAMALLTGAACACDNNQAYVEQGQTGASGNDNSASVGGSNQVAVLQAGNQNAAVTTQAGGFNNIGISQ